MRYVAIIDPKGVIANGSKQTIDRHILYANTLDKMSDSRIQLVVVTKSKKFLPYKIQENLIFIQVSQKSMLSFLFAARNILKNLDIKMLIAGDPWISFLMCSILSITKNQIIPIQVQIHADLFNKKWMNARILNLFKTYASLPALIFANSIRFVSESQFHNAKKRVRCLSNKSVIVPAYMTLEILNKSKSKKSTSGAITLGVLGRLHRERGLEKLTGFILPIMRVDNSIKLLIAGDGKYKTKLFRDLSHAGIAEKCRFLGHIEESEMRQFWEEINILVSLADSESYGRSIRESLVAGVPIWAVASSGVLELQKQVISGEVNLIDFHLDPQTQLMIIKRMVKTKISSETQKEIILQNEKSLENLLNSWLIA